MSMLSAQADELREAAKQFEGYQNGEISRMLREAADTIISLRNRLQELQGVGGESRYSALFGTPERAANVILALQICPCGKDECVFCPAHDVCFEHYKDGRTVYEMAGWLRGDAE